MTREMIDRAEALKAIQDYAVQEVGAFRQPNLKGAADAIAALPAVTVGVKPEDVLHAAHNYLMQQYGSSPLLHPIDRARILAALDLTPAPVTPPKLHVCGSIHASSSLLSDGWYVSAQNNCVTVTRVGNGSVFVYFDAENGLREWAGATAPVQPDPAAIREAALREAAALMQSMSRTRTYRDDDLGVVHSGQSLVNPLSVVTAILALIQKEPTDG